MGGLSIDKLEEQLNLLKSNFKEKQELVEEMMNQCKATNQDRRKSQVNMNVRRMTMLPLEEMKKLSQLVQEETKKGGEQEYPDVPPTEAAPPAPEEAPAGDVVGEPAL